MEALLFLSSIFKISNCWKNYLFSLPLFLVILCVLLTYPNCELANQKPCHDFLRYQVTDLISYDIMDCLWNSHFLQTLEAKITTEIQRNVKLLHLLNEKVNCLTVREGKKIQLRAKIGSGYTGRRSRELYGQRWNFFGFKMEPDFPNFFLNLDFQDSENKTPNKLIK